MFGLKKNDSVEKVLTDTIDVLINRNGGGRCVGWLWEYPGSVCVEGAMLQVLNLKPERRPELYAHPAYKALKQHLGLKSDDVWQWNDAKPRNEVLRVLRVVVSGLNKPKDYYDAGHYKLVQNFLAYKRRQELANTPKKSDHILVA